MNNPIDEIGATAFIIAAYRAMEAELDAPLFADEHSRYFVNDEVLEKARAFEKVIPEGREMIRYRIKFFADKTAEAAAAGMPQVVLLGNGFDMRAAKHVESDTVFFDVDQPAVLTFKQQVIERHAIPYRAKFVPCNYVTDDLFAALQRQGFDSGAPTLITWEGNTMYLPREKVVGLLNAFCARIGTVTVMFDFLDTRVVERTSGHDSITAAAEFFDKMGATWVTGFSDASEVAETTPLQVVDAKLMKDLREEYSPGAAHAMALFDFYSVAAMGK